MLSYAFNSACTYFYLPVDEQEDEEIASYERRYLTWTPEPTACTSYTQDEVLSSKPPITEMNPAVYEVIRNNDLYRILGISKSAASDKTALRRAYLARSKACHPDKFPGNPDATHAFQKVAVAYDVLSKSPSRRMYDNSRSRSPQYDVFAARPPGYAEETFRGVMLGIFNDFLDGDLEMVTRLLSRFQIPEELWVPVLTLRILEAISDINPSLRLGDDGISNVLVALQSIRERALACRACIHALHAELTRLLELQHAFRQLSYFDIRGRLRLAVQLTRITLRLPIALEHALREEQRKQHSTQPSDLPNQVTSLLPHKLLLLIGGADVVLERMERILK